jgi:hypothetical protein
MRVKVMALMIIASLANLYAIDSFIGRVSHLKGDVYIQRGSDLGFESATVNFPVTEGDRIATADGMAEIYIGNSNYLRLDRDTKIDVLSLSGRREGTVLRLWAGNLYISVNKLYREREIEVQIDDVTVYALQPGLYRINSFERNTAEIMVVKGAVEVQGLNGDSIVRSNQSLSWENGELQRVRTYYSSNFDEFDDFNEGRESLIKRARVQRYLPSELYDYEWELTHYGRWHYLSPYGWVWVPPYVFSEWRPYYWGRWVWYPWGWTWVPYEPWGWVTFHFGRWHWHVSIGWYWVPTTVWGPAWVHWTWGDYWIGWCPIDIYNRPVIIINNYWVTHYHDRAPSNSSSFVFIRKDQLTATDVRRGVLEKEKISQIGTVPIFKSQPDFRPTSLSPTVESYKGKIMLKNQSPVLNEENISPRAISRGKIGGESSYSENERGSITSRSRIERNYEQEDRIENRGSFVKPKVKSEIDEDGILREGRRRTSSYPSYERGTTQEDFRSIEKRNNSEPFSYRNDYENSRAIRRTPPEESYAPRDISPFNRRETTPRSSYNEERRNSSSIRDVFKPFSGSGSGSSKPSGYSGGSVFRAPSLPPSHSPNSSGSSSGGRAIKRKSD